MEWLFEEEEEEEEEEAEEKVFVPLSARIEGAKESRRALS